LLVFFSYGKKIMRPLSQDLRQRIVAARERGEGTGEVCQRFDVSRKSVERFWQQPQLTGACRPKQIGGYRRSRLEKHDRTLHDWIAKQPDLTLGELQKRCLQQLKITIGITALWHRLEQLGLSYKKNDPRRRARSA
jgi:putative transposase